MNQGETIGIVLRYRDLVTEMGGTIGEHRRVMRRRGFVWWGWWRRQAEHVPRQVLAKLFGSQMSGPVPVMLFDSGALEVYLSCAAQAVVAPSLVGMQTPQLDATPDYYVRGRYAVWYRLERDATAIDLSAISIVGRPTANAESDYVPHDSSGAELLTLEQLRDDRPTMWLASMPSEWGR